MVGQKCGVCAQYIDNVDTVVERVVNCVDHVYSSMELFLIHWKCAEDSVACVDSSVECEASNIKFVDINIEFVDSNSECVDSNMKCVAGNMECVDRSVEEEEFEQFCVARGILGP